MMSFSEHYLQTLDRAAKLWGIDLEYWDNWGQCHLAAPETKRAILNDLGVESDSVSQLEAAIENRRRKEWLRLLPPCLVIGENQRPQTFWTNVPAELAEAAAGVQIRREDGSLESFTLSLRHAPERGSAELDGRRYIRKQVALPAHLPLGYHDLQMTLPGVRESSRLIVTPDRVYSHPALSDSGRVAGIAISLYGVRSARNWGCGDFRDLRGLIDWVADEARASFVALNPLHAIHNRRPFNTSPYLPNSVFYQNFIYLDIEQIEDFARSPRARRLWSTPQVQEEIQALRNSEYVEYERVSALKLRFLKLLFLEFLREYRAHSARAQQFCDFAAKEGELLERFATYCALDQYIHAQDPDIWVWTDWPEAFQDPDSPETQAFRQKHWRAVLFYKYVQWQLNLQLAGAQEYACKRGLSIGLYYDLALATDRFGSDVWAHRPFYVPGCRVGSPPDDFAPKGQDWAFPPPCSEHHYETGYRLFAESIRKNCRYGGALRIDHVMRFFRLYWIPEGASAAQGTYVRDRYEDLIRILALESVRQRVVVVGEDLGTVEPFVREFLARFGILSYRLFYFEKNDWGDFRSYHEYPQQALVSATTHDLPTLAGFWVNADIQARQRAGLLLSEENYRAQLAGRARDKQKMLDLLFSLGLLPDSVPRSAEQIPELSGELHNAIIGFLTLTPSRMVVINQEDLTKETAQQNLPSTTGEYPNWCRKTRFVLEQMRTDPRMRDFTAMLRNWLAQTGRLNRGIPGC